MHKFCARVEIIKGEVMKFIAKVLEIKKIHKHGRVKVPLMCFTLAKLHSSRKNASISLAAKSIHLKAPPLVLLGYSYLIHIPNFETNHFLINIKITTNYPCKNKTQICASGRGMISNLNTTYVLGLYFTDPDTQSST